MRRKDREITDRQLIEKLLHQGTICSLALTDGHQPYVVPMSYGYANNILYLHSAKSGKKIDLLNKNNLVCFNIFIASKVKLGEVSCKSTIPYSSVTGFGLALLIDELAEKKVGLDIIMQQHGWNTATDSIDYQHSLTAVQVIKIMIDSITGKTNCL